MQHRRHKYVHARGRHAFPWKSRFTGNTAGFTISFWWYVCIVCKYIMYVQYVIVCSRLTNNVSLFVILIKRLKRSLRMMTLTVKRQSLQMKIWIFQMLTEADTTNGDDSGQLFVKLLGFMLLTWQAVLNISDNDKLHCCYASDTLCGSWKCTLSLLMYLAVCLYDSQDFTFTKEIDQYSQRQLLQLCFLSQV